MFLTKAHKFILDILFPVECMGCGKEDVWLCEECFNKIPLNKNYFEPLDFAPSYLDGFFIAADWQDKNLQEAIHKFKYNFVQELAEPLSQLLIKKITLFQEIYPQVRDFTIMPVPLHQKRLVWRGFNQAELLAAAVAEYFQMELNNNLLKRVKNTSPQVKLKSQARLKNIQGAFRIDENIGSITPLLFKEGKPMFHRLGWLIKKHKPSPRQDPSGPDDPPPLASSEQAFVKGRKFLLIDDVITSGATMNEIARVLKSQGAARVWGLAVARG